MASGILVEAVAVHRIAPRRYGLARLSKKACILLAALPLLVTHASVAYEQPTHILLTWEAVLGSVLSTSSTLQEQLPLPSALGVSIPYLSVVSSGKSFL
jgi:hypothetical protein